MIEKYYVYLFRLPCGTPYYVGSGCGPRALAPHTRKHHDDVIMPPTGGRTLEFVEYDISYEDAQDLESLIITELGRKYDGSGILENLTLGGNGRNGYTPPKQGRDNHSNAAKKNHAEGRYKGVNSFGGAEGRLKGSKSPRTEAWKAKHKGRVTAFNLLTGECKKVPKEEFYLHDHLVGPKHLKAQEWKRINGN